MNKNIKLSSELNLELSLKVVKSFGLKKTLLVAAAIILLPKNVLLAHCPLCTVGAGALAILAASWGISTVVVGILIGAFAMTLGITISKGIKRKFFYGQNLVTILLIFLGTIIPISPLIKHYAPLYVAFIGEYGTTYTINLYYLGSVVGALLIIAGPILSKLITKVAGKKRPFQSMLVTLALLIIISIIIQMTSLFI